jgi:hypothetical protein
MLVHIRKKEVLLWHEEQQVFVYAPDNKCLAFCQIKRPRFVQQSIRCAVQHY